MEAPNQGPPNPVQGAANQVLANSLQEGANSVLSNIRHGYDIYYISSTDDKADLTNFLKRLEEEYKDPSMYKTMSDGRFKSIEEEKLVLCRIWEVDRDLWVKIMEPKHPDHQTRFVRVAAQFKLADGNRITATWKRVSNTKKFSAIFEVKEVVDEDD